MAGGFEVVVGFFIFHFFFCSFFFVLESFVLGIALFLERKIFFIEKMNRLYPPPSGRKKMRNRIFRSRNSAIPRTKDFFSSIFVNRDFVIFFQPKNNFV